MHCICRTGLSLSCTVVLSLLVIPMSITCMSTADGVIQLVTR